MGATNTAVKTQDDLNLDVLLADLDAPEAGSVAAANETADIIEPALADESTIEAAVAEVEQDSTVAAMLEEQNQILESKDAARAAKTAGKKGKGGKSANKPAPAIPDGDGVTNESGTVKLEEATAAPKKAPTPRKHYATKVERISDKLGDKLGEYTVLELSDAALEGEALAAKQTETLEIIKGSGKKVQSRMTFVLEYVAGKSSKLNGVIVTALSLLKTDGKLTTGNEGNLFKKLVAHPYSPSAAKAMGGNTLLALKGLKVVVAGTNGDYIENPDSLILMKLRSMGV
jgi:hypothetical protein